MRKSYYHSKDIDNYERLLKILSLYRLTLGKARQEELLEHIFKPCENSDELKELFINLNPFYIEKQLTDIDIYRSEIAQTAEN